MEDIHKSTFEGMATTWEFHLVGEDADQLDSVARICGNEIELLEGKLSRFIDGSDVFRINHLRKGESLIISDECYRCLKLAVEATILTDGIFDFGAGSFMPLIRDDSGNEVKSQESDWESARSKRWLGSLGISADEPIVWIEEEGITVDFGAIGKGFALDEVSRVLAEFEVQNYLLNAGGSTWLAKGSSGEGASWKVNIAGDHERIKHQLLDTAFSVSGSGFQGDHIVRKGARFTSDYSRVWIEFPSAAMADALSTSAYLMDDREWGRLRGALPGQSLLGWRESDGKVEAWY